MRRNQLGVSLLHLWEMEQGIKRNLNDNDISYFWALKVFLSWVLVHLLLTVG